MSKSNVLICGIDADSKIRNLLCDESGKLLLSPIGRAGAEFTRPANVDAYAAGDCVSNGSMLELVVARIANGAGYVTGAVLVTDDASCTAQLRLHLFTDGGQTVDDNTAYNPPYSEFHKNYLGSIDFPALAALGTGAAVAVDNTVRVPFIAPEGGFFISGILEARGAFTPANGQKFSITLIADQN